MPSAKTLDFFVSYASVDQAWAEWIAWQLELAGYTVILQAWDFRPGQDFLHEMQRAVEEADRTIAVLSPDYFTSRFTEAEWRVIFARDVAGEGQVLLPVRVREVEARGLLATRIYIDLVGKSSLAAKRTLLEGVSKQGARPTQEPHFPGSEKPPFPGWRASDKHRLVEFSSAQNFRWIEVPKGYAVIDSMDFHRALGARFGVAVLPSAYQSFLELLDDIYINYLSTSVQPYSYGSEWVLMNERVILVPGAWIRSPRQPIRNLSLSANWLRSITLEDVGITVGAHLELCDPSNLAPFGVLSDDRQSITLLSHDRKAIAFIKDSLQKRAPTSFDEESWRSVLVLDDWMSQGFEGHVFELTRDSIAQLKNWWDW
jgi:hypothetical protein